MTLCCFTDCQLIVLVAVVEIKKIRHSLTFQDQSTMPFSTHPSGVKVYVLVLRIRECVVAECEGKRVQVLKTFIESSFIGWIFSFFVAKVSRA